MVDIIQAYNPGSSGVASAFQNAAESIFGNQAQQEMYRQNARRQQQQSEALGQLGTALSSGDTSAALRFAPVAGLPGQSAGDYLRAAAAARAPTLDDPNMWKAYVGAGGNWGGTAPGQARALAEQAATQRAIADRQARAEEFKAAHQFVNVGTDPNTGQPIHGNVNLMTGEVKPYYLPSNQPQSASGEPLQGESALAAMEPGRANIVRAMLEGRDALPSGYSLRSPQVMSLLQDAARVEPGFDANKYIARKTLETELSRATPNSMGGQLNAAGAALHHLAEVASSADAMGNYSAGGFTPAAYGTNYIANTVSNAQGAKVANLNGKSVLYGQEVAKMYGGGRTGEAERLRIANTLDPANPPVVMAGAIRAERDMIPGKLDQLVEQIAQRTGSMDYAKKLVARIYAGAPIEKINGYLARLDPSGPEAKMAKAASAGTPPAGTPQVGEEKQFKQGIGVWNGTQWVPKGAQ